MLTVRALKGKKRRVYAVRHHDGTEQERPDQGAVRRHKAFVQTSQHAKKAAAVRQTGEADAVDIA